MADPILKWAGGKRQLLQEILKRFPKDFNPAKNTYHEIFMGGGAILFHLEPQKATMNDKNSRLINFYKQVKENPKKLIKKAESFHHPLSEPNPNRQFFKVNRKGKKIKNYYYQQREIFNSRPYDGNFDPIEEAAILLYLNRTCYNGLYRENSSGGFNVPVGRYKNPDWIRKQEILQAHSILKNVKIYNQDFEIILNTAKRGDVVYCDPPYEPMSPTASFNDYSADGFDMEDQKRLLDVMCELDKGGVHIITSNSGVMKRMYKKVGFKVSLVGAKRAINSDASKRGEVNEIIATNK